jgi:hypothetical protein
VGRSEGERKVVEIRIRNDYVIANPEDRIRDYCRVDVYSGYDDCHAIDDIISAEDILAANRLFARIGGDAARRIQLSRSIREGLTVIENMELGGIGDDDWEQVRSKIENLLVSFCSIKGIAVTTKVLHLKRPELIPILDSFVVKFLLGIDTGSISGKARLVEAGVKAIDTARANIRNSWEGFISLQQKLSDLPIQLTKVRLYDILVWSTEKWDIRGIPVAPHGQPTTVVSLTSPQDVPRLSKITAPGKGDDMVQHDWVEINSEEEFNAIRARGVGYIVITDTADPNKIHTLSCPYLQLSYFREKVVKNKCRNGHYYWTTDSRSAQEKCGAQTCLKCKA